MVLYPLILMKFEVLIFRPEHCVLKMQAYFPIIPRLSKSSIGAESSLIRRLFFRTRSQSGSRKQTYCQC